MPDPTQRQQILEEAAEHLVSQGGRPLRHAAEILRRLAAAATPPGPSATVATENTPAVPETPNGDPDRQRPTEGTYRVGRKLGRTIYRQTSHEPNNDQLIGIMDTAELAAHAVRCLNRHRDLETDHHRLTHELHQAQATIATYQQAITWDTTCRNCTTLLDSAYTETRRAEQAETQRDHLHKAWETLHNRLQHALDIDPDTSPQPDVPEMVETLIEQTITLGDERDRLTAQAAHYQRIVTAAIDYIAAVCDLDSPNRPATINALTNAVDDLFDDAGQEDHHG